MRLMTAVQALGISEAAYQNAARYAKDRRQGRALTGPRDPGEPADPIIALPDVRRLLLGIRSFNEAARALLLFVALQADLSEHAAAPAERRAAGDLAALLGPVVKGLFAEQAYDNTLDAQPFFGGYGYITETGIEQFVRDVRVAAIGEGVTPVQAMDLVRRKIGLNHGETLAGFLSQVAATAGDGQHGARAAFTEPLRRALADLEAATQWIAAAMRDDPDAAGAAAVHYLHLFGRVALGWMWVRMADAVLEPSCTGAAGPRPAKLTLARFYLDRLPAETALRLAHMRHGAACLMELDDQHF
jgi:acyl-CoA dehydrogenase